MSEVQSTISYAELRQIALGVHSALSQTREEKCGKQMFAVRNILHRYGLTLEQAYELYFQYHNVAIPAEYREPEDNEPENNEPQSNEQEQPQNVPLDDPTDCWVIPWAREMDENIGNNPRLEDKDLTLLVRMQEKRRKNLRAAKEIIWLYDVARRNRQVVPEAYFQWFKTLTPEQKRLAGVL
jgi:hypothetical protein